MTKRSDYEQVERQETSPTGWLRQHKPRIQPSALKAFKNLPRVFVPKSVDQEPLGEDNMDEHFQSRIVRLTQGSLPLRSTDAKNAEILERRRLALSILTMAIAVYVASAMVADSGFKLESIFVHRLF